MIHEAVCDDTLKITDTMETLETICKRPYAITLCNTLEKADMILLPMEGFRSMDGPLFPEGTYEFFDYLRDNLAPKNVSVEICINDEDYRELELHADVLHLAEVFVHSVVLPICTGIIANYLHEKMRKYNKTDVDAQIVITVEKKGKTKRISYEGSAANFEMAMKSIDKTSFFD